jgi:hypothetical protein
MLYGNPSLFFGLDRLRYVLYCYVLYFSEHRLHQGIVNNIPAEYTMIDKWQGCSMLLKAGNVVRKDFLGGLLKSYRRDA